MAETMHHDTGINGTEAGAGISVALFIFSIVKLPVIVSLCGEYLPVVQFTAAAGATVLACIVVYEKFFKGK